MFFLHPNIRWSPKLFPQLRSAVKPWEKIIGHFLMMGWIRHLPYLSKRTHLLEIPQYAHIDSPKIRFPWPYPACRAPRYLLGFALAFVKVRLNGIDRYALSQNASPVAWWCHVVDAMACYLKHLSDEFDGNYYRLFLPNGRRNTPFLCILLLHYTFLTAATYGILCDEVTPTTTMVLFEQPADASGIARYYLKLKMSQ